MTHRQYRLARKCKKALKRAKEREYITIYEGFTKDAEWRQICIIGGTITTAVEVRKADEHLAEVIQNAARIVPWRERVTNAAVQDFVPIIASTGGHMSDEGIERQNKLKARFSGCRPICPNNHFMTYGVSDELKSCSVCDEDSYHMGVCPYCDPAYRICKACAEKPSRDQNSYGRSTCSSSSTSRPWSTAPYTRPGNAWSTSWRSTTGRPSNSGWYDTSDIAWSRDDSGWW